MSKITDRLLKFDLFRNDTTEKLHNLMQIESSSIEETINSVYDILLNNNKSNDSIDYKTKNLQKNNTQKGLINVLHAKKIERFPVFTKTKSLKYYKDNFNNLITAALFQQDNISIPFCFESNCTNPTYLSYIKDNKLEKISDHINTTENKNDKIMFIPFFINGKFFEFIKLTGDKNMPMQVKIAEGTKGLFQIADMAIIDKHRDSFSIKKRNHYEICYTKLLTAEKKMDILVNSEPKDLNINIVANNELKSLLKVIVKDNAVFIKMFDKNKIRGTSSTIVESFYEQEIIHLKKKEGPDNYNKISLMYKSVLAISALEIVLGTINSKQFLRDFHINKEINLKKKYEEFLLEHIREKLNRLKIDLSIYDENNLNIFVKNKIKIKTAKEYIDKIRQYHYLLTKRLHKANDDIASNFEQDINIKKQKLFPILNLDNLLGHGPIDGDDMLKDLILKNPDELHILLFELVPDAPHFWKKIYNCFNHLAEADNVVIAFNQTIFDVIVNNYLPSEKKEFHFDDSDEVIIIIDNNDEQLQMLHIEVFIRFLNNCYKNNKKVIYVSDNRGLSKYLKIHSYKNNINTRFDKVNQYILDKVAVSTARKPIIFNFSETKLQYPGDKLHELLCTVGDYQGKSILFGYSAPSSFALMKMYNKYFDRHMQNDDLSNL